MKSLRKLGIAAAATLLLVNAGYAQDSRNVTIVVTDMLEVPEPCDASRREVSPMLKHNVVETLTEINYTDSSLMPRLALSWEQIEPATWRFVLREGVKFHDGADFNAEAVAFGINRLLNPNLDCLDRTRFFGGFKLTTTVVDDHTIDLTTDPPQPILPTIMSVLTLPSPNTDPDAFTQNPIGTGPYRFASFDRNSGVTLERFDGYWGEQPAVESANYVWRQESAVRAAMVETGEADIALTIAPQDVNNPDTDLPYLNSDTITIRMSHNLQPLSDIRFRKALNLAVDRQAFIGTILSPDVQPATQLVVPAILGHNPDLEVWPYDPDQARQLIEEARADGVPVDAEITLFAVPALFPNVSELLEALTQMWQDVGLSVKLQMIERTLWNELKTKPFAEDRPPSLILDAHDNSRGDAVFSVFMKYSSEGVQSDINYPELDAMITAAGSQTGDARREAYEAVFAKIAEDIVAEVPLFHMVSYMRVGPRVAYVPTIVSLFELQLARVAFK